MRRSFLALVLCLFLAPALIAASVTYAALDVTTPLTGGSKDAQAPFGVMPSLAVGRTTYIPDLAVTTPAGQNQMVSAVLQSIDWNAGPGDAITITALVSAKTKQALQMYLMGEMRTNPNVRFGFGVQSFDPVAKQWYRAFDSNNVIVSGIIRSLQVGTAPYGGLSPAVYPVQIVVAPVPSEQTLVVGYSAGMIAKKWGVTVAQ